MNFLPYLSARNPPIIAPTAAPIVFALMALSHPRCTSCRPRYSCHKDNPLPAATMAPASK